MTDLNSFPDNIRAVVIGASGGIGGALADALDRHDRVQKTYRLSRRLTDGHMMIDLDDEDSIEAAAKTIADDGPLHLVINATGMLHDHRQNISPEKTWRHLNAYQIEAYFRANCIAPSLAAKHFLPLMVKDSKSVFAALSARVGSIGDNRVGGWHSYRAAKAGLNMMIRNFAIEMRLKSPHAIILGLHPGTVETGLSEPFRGMVKHDIFSAEQSANYLLDVIDQARPEQSGKHLAWDGEVIPE